MAAKRKRNYKAEYAARIARAAAKGKTRQQARGHKAKEHVVRAERSKAKYGASPATMTRLRKAAKEKLIALYTVIAKNPVSERTVARGMRMLHAEDLRELIARDDIEIIGKATIQGGAEDSYLNQLADDFPYSIDDIEAVDFNPYWYHR